MSNQMKLTFYGGVAEVSGVNFLLEGDGKKILIDAGFYTGCLSCCEKNNKPFPYNPSEIDIIFITQSHLEHSGQIPRLVREGFNGVIYSTSETKFMSGLVYYDYLNNVENSERLFEEENIEKAISLWETVPYNEDINLTKELSVCLSDSKHILGSSMVNFNYHGKNLLFANSIGSSFPKDFKGVNNHQPVNYLVIESVYGDKIHKIGERREDILENIIESTVSRKGTVFLPVSSVDKTFTLLKDINELIEKDRVPEVFVYINSPLVEKAVILYSKIFKCPDEKDFCTGFDDFAKNFKHFIFLNEDEFEKIEENKDPKIIIYESNNRLLRSKSYLSQYSQNPNNSIVFVDYQMVGSRGRKIQEGGNFLEVNNKKVPILAQIETIEGYSEHADHNKLFMFVNNIKDGLSKAFVVIGEPKSTMFFTQKLKDYMGISTKNPNKGKTYKLDF